MIIYLSRMYKFINKVFFFGDKYQCNFCYASLRKLKAYGFKFSVIEEKKIIGAGFRENVICPVCRSTDRERLIKFFIEQNPHLLSINKLLHIAPEKNLSSFIKIKNIKEYIKADKYSEGYKYPEDVVNMDITNIPFEKGYFEAIICNHVLEHVECDDLAIKEIYRVLKPGGWAILQVPISKLLENTYEDFSIITPEYRERYFGQSDHVRIYGQDYFDKLAFNGFIVERIQLWETFHEELKRIATNPKEEIFFIKKAC